LSHHPIHEQLRRALQATELSEWELARRADVSLKLVSQVLAGGAPARVDTLVQIARALEMEVTLRPKESEPRIVGPIPTVVDDALRRVRPGHPVQVIEPIPTVLALGLEGTLISEAASMAARPGLFKFLTCCRPLTQRIVIFTDMKEPRFRQLSQRLADQGSAPPWFADIELVGQGGPTKDLALVRHSDLDRVVLVDHSQLSVHPGQQACWVPIKSFAPPLGADDSEFDRVLEDLAQREFQAVFRAHR